MNSPSAPTKPLASLARSVARTEALADITGLSTSVLAVPESARAVAVAALAHSQQRRPIVVAAPTGTDAEQLAADLGAFVGAENVALFPAWETLPFERVSPATATMGQRMATLWRIAHETPPAFVVTGARALLQKLSPGWRNLHPLRVRLGETCDIEALCNDLARYGYRREHVVEHRGEFARRGSIVDVWPSTSDEPIRVDTWGDDIDRLAVFDPNDQRSLHDVDSIDIFPARELILDAEITARASNLVAREPWGREHWERLAEGQIFDGMESWMPWLVERDETLLDAIQQSHDDPLIVFVDPRRLHDRAQDLIADEDDLARALATSWDRDPSVPFPRLHLEPDVLAQSSAHVVTVVPPAEAGNAPTLEASGWGTIIHDATPVARRLNEMLAAKWNVVIAADTAESAERLRESIRAVGVDFSLADSADGPGAWIVHAPQSHGWSIPAAKCAVLCESDLSGRRRTRRPTRGRSRSSSTVFEDLHPGGYVVHAHHGVGRYEGMTTRAIGGVERDYLLIAYKGGDKLYVPTDQIGVIRQYVGGETPTLNRMGGADFARTKSRVRSAVQEVAQELVVLYQKRVNAKGHAFAPDTVWQGEMEASFPFIETPDQLDAVSAIKADMEREVPMDRLVCGDVGFGKTEVAIRAAFKAIQDGKQVAVLVPTTLLASQHGATFTERFDGYPVRVEVLSRFASAAQAKKIIAGLANGEIDCVIGTHRLLSEGITFKNLGLLIVDEEQRFGVQHKEAMKRLKHDVDVLTLSATPIPRTLEMSLVGIRDLSLLQTPPADRQPILTYVGEQSDRVAIEAIRRELLREGQVFWVHNRVQSIEEQAAQIRQWVPEARVAVAHGQMDETRLEQVVMDFWDKKFDVLVCTTIIESGIDMPTVNTLVVERADLLGLGQLHQLRGRVGRSGQRAYAYLFHPRDSRLGEEAYERLRTIGEATELGSGFKIAMRDLEIRGAGNLLGEAQSGHIAAVGYDLYCQMVTEAVAEMKGETPPPPIPEVKIDLPLPAHLPTDWMPTEELRLEAYRRLADALDDATLDDISNEWRDRYGPLPAPALALVAVTRLRNECLRRGISEVVVHGRDVRISPLQLRVSHTFALRRLAPSATWKESTGLLTVPTSVISRAADLDPATSLLSFLHELLDDSE